MLIQSSLAVALGAVIAAAVPSLEVAGNHFVNPSTGTKFQILGMAYQIGGSSGYDPKTGLDPLSHGEVCMRDAALMQQLGINTIRVYNLSPDLNHDDCASIFNAAGIYMLIDVNSPLVGESINSFEPWTSYYAAYLNRTFAIVEAFKSYPNTLAFFSGNEVISDVKTGATVPPYVRAVTRDLKQYIKKHSDRVIPVGYSAADVRDVLWDTWNYLTCAEDGNADDLSRGDIFALNSYSWCGDSSFKESGYDVLVNGFKETSVPVFYSEYGCNTPAPRIFSEVGTIYSTDMTGVFSGGVVYEFAQEDNNYGLVKYSSDNKEAQLLADYRTLQNQYAKLNYKTVQSLKSDTSNSPKPKTCSSSLITEQGFNNNFTLPVLPPGAKEIIDNGVSPKPVGKIVSISSYKVSLTVKDVDGTVIQNLAVKPLADNESNQPTATATASSTSSAATPTQTKNAAAQSTVHGFALGLVFAATAIFGSLI